MIYGATGFTGRLVTDAIRRKGICPVLAARRTDPLARLAASLGLEARVFTLDDPRRIDAALADIRVVLHAAGPFVRTSTPMLEACLRQGAHYSDLTAEIDVLEALRLRDSEARRRGITILPGAGHAVVASDCLAVHVAARCPGATTLRIALGGLARLSRGSTRALVDHAGEPVRIRRNGRIAPLAGGPRVRRFDFGYAERPALAVGWADLSTAFHSTGIPNIETYFDAILPLQLMLTLNETMGPLLRTPLARALMRAQSELVPEGPDEDERMVRRSVVVAEAHDAAGRCVRGRLFTPEVYSSTAEAAAAVVEKLLAGNAPIGFQTPASAFGSDFVLTLPGVVRQDLPAPRAREPGAAATAPPASRA